MGHVRRAEAPQLQGEPQKGALCPGWQAEGSEVHVVDSPLVGAKLVLGEEDPAGDIVEHGETKGM